MRFRFAARVVAQLGAELISSDDIAVYELVKNAFDAGSPTVTLTVEYLATVSAIHEIQEQIRKSLEGKQPLAQIRKLVRDRLKMLPPLNAACRDRLAEWVATLLPDIDKASGQNE